MINDHSLKVLGNGREIISHEQKLREFCGCYDIHWLKKKSILKGTAKFPFPSTISKHRLSLFVTDQNIINTQLPHNLPRGQA